jgi:hypothetical protein
MRKTDSGIQTLALRAWLGEDERNVRRIVELVYEKAVAGHIGYLRFLLNVVDGKIRPTAEEEMTGEADWLLVVAENERAADMVKAA